MLVESARREYLVGRRLVRRGLSRRAAIEPAQWKFAKNEHGRPSIEAPALDFDLRFNLSHTRGLAGVGMVDGLELGVDVEAIDRVFDFLPIARRKFSPSEAERVVAVGDAERRELFFRYWTLKEAFLKAKGIGLTLPLDKFSFDFREEGIVESEFRSPLPDRPQDWRFALFAVGTRHRLAVAVEAASEAEPDLLLKWFDRPDGSTPDVPIVPIARSVNWSSERLPGAWP